jgi:hypothetical protein
MFTSLTGGKHEAQVCCATFTGSHSHRAQLSNLMNVVHRFHRNHPGLVKLVNLVQFGTGDQEVAP